MAGVEVHMKLHPEIYDTIREALEAQLQYHLESSKVEQLSEETRYNHRKKAMELDRAKRMISS